MPPCASPTVDCSAFSWARACSESESDSTLALSRCCRSGFRDFQNTTHCARRWVLRIVSPRSGVFTQDKLWVLWHFYIIRNIFFFNVMWFLLFVYFLICNVSWRSVAWWGNYKTLGKLTTTLLHEGSWYTFWKYYYVEICIKWRISKSSMGSERLQQSHGKKIDLIALSSATSFIIDQNAAQPSKPLHTVQ